MNHHDATEVWHVQLPNGQAHAISLDELDAAFEAGHITEHTFVLPPGATQWVTLGDAAGLQGDASATPAPVTSDAYGPSSLAPVALPSAAPSMAPALFYEPPPAPELPDVDFESAHKKGRVKMFVGAAVAGVALIAVGLVGVRAINKAETDSNTMKTALSAPPQPETKLSGNDDSTPANAQRFNDDQKKKLEEADKARAAAAASKKKARDDARPAAPHGKPYKGDDPLKKSSGNKFDPLNGSL